MSNSNAGYGKTARPQSTLARSFSAALDEMFKLDGVGALELSVEQKKSQVQDQERSLENLDAKLREANERLKKLEAKHKRQSQMYSPTTSSRPNARHIFRSSDAGGSEDSGGDSDPMYGRTSPESGEEAYQRRQ